MTTAAPVATPPPRALFRRILASLARVAAALSLVCVVACSLIAQPTTRSVPPSAASADTGSLRRHVTTLSQTYHPRNSENIANLDRCAEYIAGHLRPTGASVRFQEFTAQDRPYRNVIASFPHPSGKKIIIGAHYDSYADTPGADDNASAVAGLLELARLIAASPPEIGVELVAYTLEEPPFFGGPLMGSAIHAQSVAAEKESIIGVIVLEMIGYFSDQPGSQSYPTPLLKLFYPSRGNFITVVGRWDQGPWIKQLKGAMKGATPLPVYSFRGPEALPGVDFSDHRNYWPHGIPAAMVTNTAFYRNREYHTPNDTADRLDYDRLAMVVVAVHQAIRHIAADLPAPPSQANPPP